MKVVSVVAFSVAVDGSVVPKKYARGYVRNLARNGVVEVAEITDEMRAAAPDSLDWSAKGATTPVKDQGTCGSCWAFSAIQGIESAVFMSSRELPPPLSTQQLVDCDESDGGCDGGDLPTAFDYAKKNGIDTDQDYPDTSSDSGEEKKCTWSGTKAVTVSGWKYAIPPCNSGSCKNQKESDMMAALNEFGPLSVCVNANDWDTYEEGGIYTKKCSGKAGDLDHCVQLVGYDKTQGYWKVRNSWTSKWGEQGFIRLPMGENACGIADEVTYVEATMEKPTTPITTPAPITTPTPGPKFKAWPKGWVPVPRGVPTWTCCTKASRIGKDCDEECTGGANGPSLAKCEEIADRPPHGDRETNSFMLCSNGCHFNQFNFGGLDAPPSADFSHEKPDCTTYYRVTGKEFMNGTSEMVV